MQFAQSGSDSTAEKEPASRVWPQRVVTGPVRGTFGVRWIRPPDLRRTDSRRTWCTPKSWGAQAFGEIPPFCAKSAHRDPRIDPSCAKRGFRGTTSWLLDPACLSRVGQRREVGFHLCAQVLERGRQRDLLAE